jgi:broad specificity phosphatase PhoE
VDGGAWRGRRSLAGSRARVCGAPSRRQARETLPALAARARALVAWLQRRPDREVCLVTHSDFLTALLHCALRLDDAAPAAARAAFANAEVRTFALAWAEDAAGDGAA